LLPLRQRLVIPLLESVPVSLFAIAHPRAHIESRSFAVPDRRILLPTELAESHEFELSRAQSPGVCAALHDGRVLDAMVEWNSLIGKSHGDSTPLRFLFGAAHSLMEHGNFHTGERCLQAALGVLAEGGPAGPRLEFSEWLVLATRDLVKKEWQSCGLWLRQAGRCLYRHSDMERITDWAKAAGDVFAVQGCVKAEQGDSEGGCTLLLRAIDSHDTAAAHCAAARDLILLSRILAATESFSSAEQRLLEAEARLEQSREMAHTNVERLRNAIEHDYRVIAGRRVKLAKARWN
jgi:hypothetical protein